MGFSARRGFFTALPHAERLPRRRAVVLLRAGISGLSMLCLKRCRCVELLLDARLSLQRRLGLLGLRGTAGGGRNRSLTEAAGAERQTRHEHKNYPFHLVTPLTRYLAPLQPGALLGRAQCSIWR